MAHCRSNPAMSVVVYWLCIAAPMLLVLGPQQPAEVVVLVVVALVGACAVGVDRRRFAWIIGVLTRRPIHGHLPVLSDLRGARRSPPIDLIDALIDAGVGPRAPTSALFAA